MKNLKSRREVYVNLAVKIMASSSQEDGSSLVKSFLEDRGSRKHSNFVEKCRSTYISRFMSAKFFDESAPDGDPEGCVDMGVSQNKISAQAMRCRVEQCTLDMSAAFSGGCDPLAYGPMHGLPRLRAAFARALERYVFTDISEECHTVNPDAEIMVNNGATSTVSLLASVLCDNIEDSDGGSFLLINPRYPGFQTDITGYANVPCTPVLPVMSGELPSDAELDQAYTAAALKKKTVRALIICTPDNPTGRIFDKEDLQRVVEWCRKKRVYSISDEIYAVSAIEGGKWYSLWKEADCVIWGFSKDLCASGLRCSVLYTRDRILMDRCLALCMPYAISGVAQVILSQILEDFSFLDSFFLQMRQDLRVARTSVIQKLRELDIPFAGAKSGEDDSNCHSFAGMFLWANLSEFGQDSLQIFQELLDGYKLFLTPGEPFYDREDGERLDEGLYGGGWMRICFAASGDRARAEGLRRLEAYTRDKRRKG